MIRKKFSAEFKAAVALEFMKDEHTIAELASKYGVHPTQIKEWKARLVNGASELFDKRKGPENNTNKGYVEAFLGLSIGSDP